ncbi:hypothetical protein [Mucilaginibacter panaciglaebae]|uniref:Natural product n=1 Tax=Mucilaginibacter panaciglaebae TaxID=502331 RepID=A0ABP7X2P7_9SPHI
MKKLQLKLDGVKDMLTREQMKKIMGGSGSGSASGSGSGTSCSASCPSGQSATITNCHGDCTGHDGYAECVGAHNTLKKNCA